MDYRYILLLLLVSHLAFADCVGYVDSFDVRVLDAKLRPVAGAEVQLTYDRGASFGDKYFTTPTQYTNEDGIVHFDIVNQGTLTRSIDCSIDIEASAGGDVSEKTITANVHGPIVDISFEDVYPLSVFVHDQLGRPLANASVTIGSKTEKTNENGRVKYHLQSGDYDYFISYLGSSRGGLITVGEDGEFDVVIRNYDIAIDVIDEFGAPLNVTLQIGNETLDIEGHFERAKVFGDYIEYTVTYDGRTESGAMIPEEDPSIEIVFDMNPPLIEDLIFEISDDRAEILIPVYDPGEKASGVDFSSLSVRYRVEPTDPTTPFDYATVFSAGFNRFTAEFSRLPNNSIIGFTIDVKDNTGNRASVDGKFSTLKTPEPVNDTQNQTNTQKEPEQKQELPLFYIIGGTFLIILIIYLGIRIKRQG